MGSELQVDVAEFFWRDVQVVANILPVQWIIGIFILVAYLTVIFQLDGSMIIVAENVMGSMRTNGSGEPILGYGHR